MFCPNCGTQNDEAATTCKKCGFNLKGAAAPKFKGTMLMMNNSPGGAPRPGAPGPAPGQAPPNAVPPPQGAPRPQLKGTMLGVAPPALGGLQPPLPAPAPTPAPPAPAPTAAFGAVPPPAAPPPAREPAVNPLGGTLVADAAAFRAPQPPAAAPPYGPSPGGFGAPPQQPPGFGSPPGQYPPQPGFAPPPQAPPAFAPPAGGAFPAPAPGAPGGPEAAYPGAALAPQAPAPYSPGFGGAPGALAPAPGPAYGPPGAHGPVGQERNPVLVFAISTVCFVYALLQVFQMFGELKAFRQKDDPNPIFIFIPILNLLTFWKLAEQVLEAKRLAGIPNPSTAHPVLYLLLWSYFLPLELNEIWKAAGGSPRLSQGN